MTDIPYTLHATQVDGGVDIELTASDDMRLYPIAEMSADGTKCVLHLRSYKIPRIGSRVCVHRMLIKVAEIRFSDNGALMVRDEDTGAWLQWPNQ